MAFHLHRNGTSTVFEIAKLRDMARVGELPQDEYVYADDKGEWLPAAQVPELVGAWNIDENEATVAVQLTPDLLATMASPDGNPALLSTAGVVVTSPRPLSAPVVAEPVAPQPVAVTPVVILPASVPTTDAGNEATAFMQVPAEVLQAQADARAAKQASPPPSVVIQAPAVVIQAPAPTPTPTPAGTPVVPKVLVAKTKLPEPPPEEDQPTTFMAALPEELIQRPARAPRDTAVVGPQSIPVTSGLPAKSTPSALATSTREHQKALLLSIGAGFLGADRFYLGYRGLAIAKALTLGLVGIWWIADIVLLATGKMTDAEGKPLQR